MNEELHCWNRTIYHCHLIFFGEDICRLVFVGSAFSQIPRNKKQGSIKKIITFLKIYNVMDILKNDLFFVEHFACRQITEFSAKDRVSDSPEKDKCQENILE